MGDFWERDSIRAHTIKADTLKLELSLICTSLLRKRCGEETQAQALLTEEQYRRLLCLQKAGQLLSFRFHPIIFDVLDRSAVELILFLQSNTLKSDLEVSWPGVIFNLLESRAGKGGQRYSGEAGLGKKGD